MAASAPFFEHLAAAYEFPKGPLVIDLGGGSGAPLAAILVARSDLRWMIVVARVGRRICRSGWVRVWRAMR